MADHSVASPRPAPAAPAASTHGLSAWFERRASFVLPFPAVATVALMLAFPLAYTLYLSVQDFSLASTAAPKFVGLDNYITLFTTDTRFKNSIFVTFYFTLLGVTVQTFLGVTLALLFNRQFWGRGLLRTLAILPMVATPVAIALIFVLMYHPTLGVMNYFLSVIGLPPWSWTYASGTVIPALVIVDTWQWTPLIMLIVLAGLAALPGEPYEAAMIDGASKAQMLWTITLPLLRPTIVTAALFRLIDSLKTFDIIFVMTQGGPGGASDTINIYLFNTAFSYFHMGMASSMVVIFFAIILGVSVLAMRIRRASWL
ncbi:MAG: sugar ABC transporter permease [Chloroflexi bacterium]|nr:sugar ABC transporter permease [Chloroflexota bacterium]